MNAKKELRHRCQGRLLERRQRGLWRDRWQVEERDDAGRVRVDGQWLRNFASNDYLGLSRHPQVVEAVAAAVRQHGWGSGASHLVSGHSHLHQALEQRLAGWLGFPRALVFSTGFMANQAIATTLFEQGDKVLADRLIHASIIDGLKLSEVRFRRYRHLDESHMAALWSPGERGWIWTEGVFSMDGDSPNLRSLAGWADKHGAWLVVDDAHGLGVLGPEGRGTLAMQGVASDNIALYMGTFGKALGGFGAFVAGSDEIIETLMQFARPYIYTTALPPAAMAGVHSALDLLEREPDRQASLLKNVQLFQQACMRERLPVLPSESAIQPVVLGDEQLVMSCQAYLRRRGFWVGAIRPPTVPKGTARLRITLSAVHQREDILELVAALADFQQHHQKGQHAR